MLAPGAAAADEAGPLQHADVFRDGVEGHGEGLGEVGDAGLAAHEAFEDGPSCGVGEGAHGAVDSGGVIHLFS